MGFVYELHGVPLRGLNGTLKKGGYMAKETVVVAKPFWKSTTLWLNVLAVAVVALQYITDKHLLQPEYEALILAVLNIVNRFKSSIPVKI